MSRTCTRAIFHHTAGHGAQLECLAFLCWDEVDGDIGDGDDACHDR